MRQCFFCKKWFSNKQAVRAHLRFCPVRKADAEKSEVHEPSQDLVVMFHCTQCGRKEVYEASCGDCGAPERVEVRPLRE